MLENALIITVVIPTICYFIAGVLQTYMGNPWHGLMWIAYSIANFAIMKGQGII